VHPTTGYQMLQVALRAAGRMSGWLGQTIFMHQRARRSRGMATTLLESSAATDQSHH
jgi:hypothetical protein